MLVAPLILLLITFDSLFLWNVSLPWEITRWMVTVLFVGAIIAAIVLIRSRSKAIMLVCFLILAVLLWYHLLPPSNDRHWRPEVARVARVEFNGDIVTIENVRNFHYRTKDDFDEIWETRTYDLSYLETVDTYFCYWGPSNIAHTMLTFGFNDDTQICLSAEVRKEVGEEYSPIASFVKKFELIYIVGDERDLVAMRTNHRKEDVYLFPSKLPPEKVRALLADILARVNSLADAPVFYGTINDNCTTSLVGHINKVRDEPIRFSLELLLNGHIPEMAWRRGNLGDHDISFDIVKRHYAISERAQAYGDGPEYSQRIRQDLGLEGD